MASQIQSVLKSKATVVRVLTRAGVIRPMGPATLGRLGRTVAGHGLGFAGAFGAAAVRFPARTAVIDERGRLTYGALDERANALADSLAASGVGEGDAVALLARNHRGFIEVAVAATRLGADVLLLNTSFAGPQMHEVCEREGAKWLIFDEEFTGLVDKSGLDLPRMLSWVEDGSVVPDGVDTTEAAIARGSRARREAPDRLGRTIILTSGTTGTPKGAARGAAHIDVPVGLLERIPYRSGMVVHDAAPLFHFWGLSQYQIALLLGNTVVLTRKFEPVRFLDSLRDHQCDAAVVIPVMLQRVLALPDETKAAYSLPDLKIVAASGSALPGELALAWMDAFGDNLYNTYGSTEVSLVTIATPEDMRRLPGTAGRPAVTSTVRLFDAEDKEVPQGVTGRIFAGNSMLFEGYTGGGNKQVIEGLMSTGDVGRFDEAGRLFIEGRDDEMIVSGGENVFPKEVEDCLARHEAILEVAAIGVDDHGFGKRLRAFVVTAEGREVSEDELREWVKANLARYKVPRDFVFLDELPRNPTGKVLKRELADLGD